MTIEMPEHNPIHFYPTIKSEDVQELYQGLQKAKFPFHGDQYIKIDSSQNRHARATTLGFVWVRPPHRPFLTLELSVFSKKYPHLVSLASSLAHSIDPNFDFTSIQVNHNCVCMPHVDDSNIGESILVSFGDYIGGELNLKIADTIHTIDTDLQPIRFNGSTYYHWNNSIKSGNKYSIVFYNRWNTTKGNKFHKTINYRDILKDPSIEPIVQYFET